MTFLRKGLVAHHGPCCFQCIASLEISASDGGCLQVEHSLQDREEAIQQQQEVLLLAFSRFQDLLADAEKACTELDASGTTNGTTEDEAGMCARMLCVHSLLK